MSEPFPRETYDVIVMDGSLGHFALDVTRRLIEKIRGALADDGVFVGSEVLGIEGHDHLQYFDQLADIGTVLQEHFKHVQLRSIRYVIPSGAAREEAYWRCSRQRAPLEDVTWHDHVAARPEVSR